MTYLKSLRFLSRALAASVLAVTVLASYASVRAEVIEQVLIRVNGEILTKSDLETRQVGALRQMGQQVDPKSDLSDAQLRKMLDDVTPQLMVTIVDEMLFVQRGRELGYRMADDQFQTILESIKKDNKIESEEQFQAALKQENMTLPELRRNLERQMIISRVQQNEVLGKVAVSDEELRQYYDAHRAEFTTPQNVTLREILVVSGREGATPSPSQDAAARDKAAGIRQRALAGESFEKLAADLSDAPSRANAGLIGPLSLSDLSPELQKLIASMKAGDVTEPLKGSRGYQILKLESSSAAETLPFEKAREDIGNKVFDQKRQGELLKYLQKLRAQADIDWKNPDLKKAYDQGILLQANAAPTAPR